MSSQAPFKVLCICLGNICRSPTAEVVLRHFCEQQSLYVEVDSAGTSNYHPNKAPDPRSQKHALSRGYDLTALRARQVQLIDFVDFNLILAMDTVNLADLKALQVQAQAKYGATALNAKLALMSEHDPLFPKQALPDPYYGDAAGFERVLDQCESSSLAWANYLQQHLTKKL